MLKTKLKSAKIAMVGLVVLIAGVTAAVGSATTVNVPDPKCWAFGPPYTGEWICNDHLQQTFSSPPYVNMTVYPLFVEGTVVTLIGLVTLGVGIGLPKKEHEGWSA